MALATFTDVENLLGGADTGDDALIANLIGYAQSAIEEFVGRTLEDGAVSGEIHDGPGNDVVLLQRWPITTTSGVAITEDGTALVNGTDFVAYTDGRVRRIAAGGYGIPWTDKPAAISASYSGGYVTVPGEITQICARMAARAYQAGQAYADAPAGSAGIRQVTLAGSDSMTFGTAVSMDVTRAAVILLDDERMALRRYRDVGVH